MLRKMVSFIWKIIVRVYKRIFPGKDDDIEMVEMLANDITNDLSEVDGVGNHSAWNIRMSPEFRFICPDDGSDPTEFTIVEIDLCSDTTKFYDMAFNVEPIHLHLSTKLYALDLDLPQVVDPKFTFISYFVPAQLLHVHLRNHAYGRLENDVEDALVELV